MADQEGRLVAHKIIPALLKKYAMPVYKLPAANQAAEIDKRAADLFNAYGDAGIVPSMADFAVVCGVYNPDILYKWRDLKSGHNEEYSGDDRLIFEDRARVIKKWLSIFGGAALSAVQQSRNPAGPMFLAKSVYKYREYEDPKKIELSIKYEDLTKAVEDYERTKDSTLGE